MGSARLRSRLPSLVARNLARRTLTVPEDLPLSEAVRRAQEAEAGSIVTVTGSGQPVGIVNEAALLATPEDRRPWVAVSTVARAAEQGLRLPVAIGGEELILAISRHPAAEYLLVEEDGGIFGVLTTADVDRAFRARAHYGPREPRSPASRPRSRRRRRSPTCPPTRGPASTGDRSGPASGCG